MYSVADKEEKQTIGTRDTECIISEGELTACDEGRWRIRHLQERTTSIVECSANRSR